MLLHNGGRNLVTVTGNMHTAECMLLHNGGRKGEHARLGPWHLPGFYLNQRQRVKGLTHVNGTCTLYFAFSSL